MTIYAVLQEYVLPLFKYKTKILDGNLNKGEGVYIFQKFFIIFYVYINKIVERSYII